MLVFSLLFEFLFGLVCCELKAAELLCSVNLYFLLVTTRKWLFFCCITRAAKNEADCLPTFVKKVKITRITHSRGKKKNCNGHESNLTEYLMMNEVNNLALRGSNYLNNS